MAVKTKVVQKPKIIKSIISKSTLVNELLKIEKSGATFCKAKSITEPKMNKRNNPFYGKILKKSEIIAIINFDYENNVNNARVKETLQMAKQFGVENSLIQKLLNELSEKERKEKAKETTTKFKAKERKWGKHIFNPYTRKYSRIMLEHTNKAGQHKNYVQVRVLKTKKPEYFYKDSQEKLNEIEIKQLKEFFPKRQRNKNQELNEENEIIVRDYTLENVIAINLNKRKFIIQ